MPDIENFLVSNSMLTGHVSEGTITVEAISPKTFMESAGTVLDMQEMEQKFKDKICDDYGETFSFDTSSKALSFAHKMIYEVGPNSRGKKDKVWTFQFMRGNNIVKCNVLTMKVQNNKLASSAELLTVKRATLLAIKPFNTAARIIFDQKANIMLTPLAAATFGTDSINKLSEIIGLDEPDTICAINASTCSGGHLLDESSGPIAVVAAINATLGKEESLSKGIVSKIVKQYAAVDKLSASDLTKISSIAQYASGGVPSGFEYEKLMDIYKEGRVAAITQVKLKKAQQTRDPKVNIPELEAEQKK